jgi:hypothetical protein
MSDYNGWKNYQTWNVNLWLQESGVTDDFFEESRRMDIYQLADHIRQTFDEIWPIPDESGPLADLLGSALDAVDWCEIAEHYVDDSDDSDGLEFTRLAKINAMIKGLNQ